MSAKRDERPRYRVTETSYIDHNLVEAGQEVDYDGVPGSKLIPINDTAEEAKELAAADIEKARTKVLRDNAPASRIVADEAVDKAVQDALNKRDKEQAKKDAEREKRHQEELDEVRKQAKEPKKTGGPADDANKDPTLVARGGETEAATPVKGQGPHSDPNSALSETQRQGAVEASKGGEGKSDLV